MQKIRPPQQESTRADEMIPSISNHRCGPNSRLTSLSSIREKIGNHGQDLHSSPLMKTVEIAASLVSTTGNDNLDSFQERNENTSIVRLEHKDRLNSLAPGILEATNNDIGREYTSPEVAQKEVQEDNTAYKYDDTFALMIIDTGNDIGICGCAAKYECDGSSSSLVCATMQSPTKEQNSKPFCPDRTPRRSSMKGSDGAQASSPSSERRASILAQGETYEILLPGQSKPVQRQRSITFDNNVNIQNIEPIRLLSAGGPQSLWYQENEYETIKFKTLALLDRVDHSSGVVDGKKYCTRGLEKFMSPESAEVKRHQAWDAVLNEQFLQRKDGEFD